MKRSLVLLVLSICTTILIGTTYASPPSSQPGYDHTRQGYYNTKLASSAGYLPRKGGSSKVYASATAVSVGGGKTRISSTSSSKIEAEVKDAVAESVSEAISEVIHGGGAEAVAVSLAKAIGEAVARAVSKTSVIGSVDGHGSAVGIANAWSYSYATAASSAVASAFAAALNGRVTAAAKAAAEAVAMSVAQALAIANSSVKIGSHGSAAAKTLVIAEAIAYPITEALAEALTEVEHFHSFSKSIAFSSSDTYVDLKTEADTSSESFGNAIVFNQFITKANGQMYNPFRPPIWQPYW